MIILGEHYLFIIIVIKRKSRMDKKGTEKEN
jgi:hypothetical protein